MPKNDDHLKTDLPAHAINLTEIKDKELIQQAEERLDEWLQEVHKKITELLKENGINSFTLSFLHEGMKSPVLLSSGSKYEAAKLSVAATNQLFRQLEQDLKVDKPNFG
jgi:DNA-binding transcriptional MerR regulator